MDEHPGDTLGKRFLTFWGALAAIVAVAALLGLYRWMFLPGSDDPTDGGEGAARAKTVAAVQSAQRKEFNAVAEVKAGETVRLPAVTVIPHAVSVLGAQKPAPSAIKTPETIAREAASKHDPNQSKFEGK